MLILTAVVCKLDGSPDFAAPHMEVLKKWCEYLLTYGADPGEQLCTDDFAGHLSHNVNLSAKAIMGIEAFALLARQMGQEEVYGEMCIRDSSKTVIPAFLEFCGDDV